MEEILNLSSEFFESILREPNTPKKNTLTKTPSEFLDTPARRR